MAYRDNHIASACYLSEWAGDEGRLYVVRPPSPIAVARRPEKVGFRKHFWGPHPAVRRAAEEHTNRIESDAARALPRLPARWPLVPGSRDWLALAFLVALHLWRNPFGQAKFLRIQQNVLMRRLPHYAAGWSQSQVEDFLSHVTSDGFRAEVMLGDLPKLASLLGSMHWTLLEFGAPLLATSDQPVTVVPLLDASETAPVTPLPQGPILDVEEIRLALGPRHALLMTWLDEPDDGPAVRGGHDEAAQLNRAVIGQADREWFHHPARRPTTLTPPLLQADRCGPLGREVLPAYDWRKALDSRRRRETAANLEQMVENRVNDHVRIVSVRRHAA